MITQGTSITNKRTGQRMTFLNTWAETNGARLEIDCFSPPTKAREPEHVHPYQVNQFTILSGQLIFRINGKEQVARPGEVVTIEKNIPHHFWNPGETEAHYIQEFFPALQIDSLFETFFALARDGKLNKKGAPNIFRAALIMLEFESVLRLAKPAWVIQKILFRLLAPIGRMLKYQGRYV